MWMTYDHFSFCCVNISVVSYSNEGERRELTHPYHQHHHSLSCYTTKTTSLNYSRRTVDYTTTWRGEGVGRGGGSRVLHQLLLLLPFRDIRMHIGFDKVEFVVIVSEYGMFLVMLHEVVQ